MVDGAMLKLAAFFFKGCPKPNSLTLVVPLGVRGAESPEEVCAMLGKILFAEGIFFPKRFTEILLFDKTSSKFEDLFSSC